jgi:hypothetical protein
MRSGRDSAPTHRPLRRLRLHRRRQPIRREGLSARHHLQAALRSPPRARRMQRPRRAERRYKKSVLAQRTRIRPHAKTLPAGRRRWAPRVTRVWCIAMAPPTLFSNRAFAAPDFRPSRRLEKCLEATGMPYVTRFTQNDIGKRGVTSKPLTQMHCTASLRFAPI